MILVMLGGGFLLAVLAGAAGGTAAVLLITRRHDALAAIARTGEDRHNRPDSALRRLRDAKAHEAMKRKRLEEDGPYDSGGGSGSDNPDQPDADRRKRDEPRNFFA